MNNDDVKENGTRTESGVQSGIESETGAETPYEFMKDIPVNTPSEFPPAGAEALSGSQTETQRSVGQGQTETQKLVGQSETETQKSAGQSETETQKSTVQSESETQKSTVQSETETQEPAMQSESEMQETVGQNQTETREPAGPELLQKLAGKPEVFGIALLLIAAFVLLWKSLRKPKEKPAQESTLHGQDAAPAVETERTLIGVAHGIGGRSDQQDSYGLSDESGKGLWQEKGLFAVLADGMGGLLDGGAVSRLAVSACADTFLGAEPGKDPADLLLEAARATNIRVNAMLGPNIRKSGTTLVQALVRRGKLYFLTVGDSRIYLYRGGRLLWLNRPHVYAEELALDGVNGRGTLDQVHRNAQKGALTSFIGAGTLAHIDRSSEGIALMPGDKVLLASDGVFGTLEDWQMEQALENSADAAAREIGRKIEEAGKEYQDNYTAVILAYPKLYPQGTP